MLGRVSWDLNPGPPGLKPYALPTDPSRHLSYMGIWNLHSITGAWYGVWYGSIPVPIPSLYFMIMVQSIV